ncbi:hypothetical protein EV715DRAFT_262408 [Schizophyllum commune]
MASATILSLLSRLLTVHLFRSIPHLRSCLLSCNAHHQSTPNALMASLTSQGYTVRTTRLIMLDFLDGLEADRSTLFGRERPALRRSTTSRHFDLTYGPMSQPLRTVTTPAAFLAHPRGHTLAPLDAAERTLRGQMMKGERPVFLARCPFGEFKPPGASARSRGERGDGGEVLSYPLSPTIGGGALAPFEMTFCGEGDRRRLVRGSSTEGCDEGEFFGETDPPEARAGTVDEGRGEGQPAKRRVFDRPEPPEACAHTLDTGAIGRAEEGGWEAVWGERANEGMARRDMAHWDEESEVVAGARLLPLSRGNPVSSAACSDTRKARSICVGQQRVEGDAVPGFAVDAGLSSTSMRAFRRRRCGAIGDVGGRFSNEEARAASGNSGRGERRQQARREGIAGEARGDSGRGERGQRARGEGTAGEAGGKRGW